MFAELVLSAMLLGVSVDANTRAKVLTLDRAITKLGSGAKSAREFERIVPESSIGRWRQIAHKVPADSVARVEIAFVLAYYGVDYTANLRLMTRPFSRDANSGSTPIATEPTGKQNGPTDSDSGLQSIASMRLLRIFYEQKHRRSTLSALVQLPCDGADEEDLTSVLERLWPDHRTAMLECAYGSKKGVFNLYATLVDMLRTSPKKRRDAFRSHTESLLKRDTRSNNAHLATSAVNLLRELKRHPDMWGESKVGGSGGGASGANHQR